MVMQSEYRTPKGIRHSDVALTLQRYTHAVSRDRMVATGKMLSAILSHAPGKNGRTAY